MKDNGLLAGSFDPFTYGHYDIAARWLWLPIRAIRDALRRSTNGWK